MGRQEDFLNGDFDFDGEDKDFRNTLGMVGIIIGILLIVFNSYLLSKVLPTVIHGQSFVAQINRGSAFTVAEYELDGKKYTFNLSDTIVRENQKTVRFYYTDDIKEAITVNWPMYIISYVAYIAMVGFGILGVENISVKDLIKNRYKRKSIDQKDE